MLFPAHFTELLVPPLTWRHEERGGGFTLPPHPPTLLQQAERDGVRKISHRGAGRKDRGREGAELQERRGAAASCRSEGGSRLFNHSHRVRADITSPVLAGRGRSGRLRGGGEGRSKGEEEEKQQQGTNGGLVAVRPVYLQGAHELHPVLQLLVLDSSVRQEEVKEDT